MVQVSVVKGVGRGLPEALDPQVSVACINPHLEYSVELAIYSDLWLSTGATLVYVSRLRRADSFTSCRRYPVFFLSAVSTLFRVTGSTLVSREPVCLFLAECRYHAIRRDLREARPTEPLL